MLFYLATLGLSRFLTETVPVVKEQDPNSVMAVGLWKDSDFLCRNYILNGLVDSLYDVYRKINTAKALWAALDHKYQSEDAGQKKFVVGRSSTLKWWIQRLCSVRLKTCSCSSTRSVMRAW